jgi:hypothetical protein
MTEADVRAERLRNLLLTDQSPRSPLEVVEWLGAIQSQDLASSMWSIGVRTPGSTEASIASAFEDGQILRTWPMRGTIHAVPSVDAAWMLAATGIRALDGSARRREQLGLTVEDAERATASLVTALAGGRRLTRAEALTTIDDAGVQTTGQRGYHLLSYAAHIGVICIGPQQGSQQTFVLLDEWAPSPRRLTRSEGLVELAFRYFRSHGPTTVRDFAGWTGLTLTESRAAVAGNDGRLNAIDTGPEARWAAIGSDGDTDNGVDSILALPGFDELILGYKDRSLHVPEGMLDRIVPGGNGVFRATLVEQGVVIATWHRAFRKGRVDITVEPFADLTTATQRAATSALEHYATYLDRLLTVTFSPAR